MIHKLLSFLSFFLLVLVAQAQQDDPCQNVLDKAKQAYNVGKVKEVKTILNETCIKVLPRKENIMEAYYLLCTASLFLNEKEEATQYMLRLLKLEPEFAVEPSMPVEFKQFHEAFKVAPVVTVGLRVGANLSFVQPFKSYSISNMLPDSKLGSYNAKTNIQFGVVGYLPITKKLDFSAEFTYRTSAYEFQNVYLSYVNLTFTETQKYLEVPLMLKYNFRNKFDFTRDRRSFKNKLFPYISFGGTLSRLNSSKGVAVRLDSGAETTPLSLESEPQDMITARNTNKIFATGAVGLEYKSGRSILALEIRYNRMFGKQVKPEHRYDNQNLLLKYAYIDNDFNVHNTAITLSFMYPFYKARPKKTKSLVKPRIIDVEHTDK